MATAVREVVAAEGPVHVERLARLVAACFGLSRLNQSRVTAIVRTVPRDLAVRQDFVWPVQTEQVEWTGFRADPGGERPLEQVSLREIGNAMVGLCRDAAGMDADELSVETLAIFGWKRRTPKIAERLEAARVSAVSDGRLVEGLNGLHRLP